VIESGIFARVEFLNEFCFEKRLQRVVERAGTEAHSAGSLVGDVAHDGVAVEVVSGEGQEDLESGGRERGEFLFWHSRLSIYRCASVGRRWEDVKRRVR